MSRLKFLGYPVCQNRLYPFPLYVSRQYLFSDVIGKQIFLTVNGNEFTEYSFFL